MIRIVHEADFLASMRLWCFGTWLFVSEHTRNCVWIDYLSLGIYLYAWASLLNRELDMPPLPMLSERRHETDCKLTLSCHE